jgi:hypothetical protein
MRGPSPDRIESLINTHTSTNTRIKCRFDKCWDECYKNDRCGHHHSRYKKYNRFCSICDINKEDLQGCTLDSVINHISSDSVCKHWFCTACIDKYMFTFCPRCGRYIDTLQSNTVDDLHSDD